MNYELKIKRFITMTVAAVAIVLGVCSCGSDDKDEPKVALATQVAGSYSGIEIFVVDNEESSNETKTYEFVKATDTSIDMHIPEVGMGMMTIPSFSVKGITLIKDGDTVVGWVDSYEGVTKGADGSDKAYTVSDVVVMFSGETAVVTYTLKYGRMPFPFTGSFTGAKKN